MLVRTHTLLDGTVSYLSSIRVSANLGELQSLPVLNPLPVETRRKIRRRRVTTKPRERMQSKLQRMRGLSRDKQLLLPKMSSKRTQMIQAPTNLEIVS